MMRRSRQCSQAKCIPTCLANIEVSEMWFFLVLVIVILVLFGDITLENNWSQFLFEIRVKSSHPQWFRFNFLVFKIWFTK